MPSGQVTFCFSDIEGSTRLLATVGQRAYTELLRRHREILRDAWCRYRGDEVRVEGDGFFVAFRTVDDGLDACVYGQQLLGCERWAPPVAVRVRMGIHTGEARPDETEDYNTLAVHQAARIVNCAHGGQVVVSADAAALATDALQRLKPLGRFRVHDFPEPQVLYQATGLGMQAEFPPLRQARPLDPVAAVGLPAGSPP